MRALWLIIPVVVLAGCDFGLKTCTTNDDCVGLNATCDTAVGFCVRDPLDGGPTGGGGGAMTGGGGGTTGGGTPDGGPDAGADAGVDGGADSGVDAGVDSGVDAGVDSGVDAGADAGFDAGTCSFSTCAVGQECLNDTCTAVDLTIVQVGAPPTVGRIPVSVTGRIQRTSDAGIMGFKRPLVVMLTSSAALQFPSTALVAGDSTFVISVTSDAGSGPATINASATLNPGAANGVLNVTSDTTGPNFDIVSSSLAQTFQRDDIYSLAVDTLEPLNGPPTVRFGGLTVNPTSTGCTGDAGCWRIDMSVPPLDAMTGNIDLVISGTDRYGNNGSSSSSVSVTRKRWEVQAVGLGETVRASPAIGADGVIYVGSFNNAVTGSLVGINPTDGGIMRSAANPGAIQSLAVATSVTQGNSVGEELVFFTANDTLGRLGARKASDLTTTGVRNAETGNLTDPTASGLALLQLGAGQVGAVGTFNGAPAVPSRFSVFKPSSAAAGVDAPDGGFTFSMSVSLNTGDVPNNILVDGPTAHFTARPNSTTCTAQSVTSITSTPAFGRTLPLSLASNCGVTAQGWVGTEPLVSLFNGAPLSINRVGVSSIQLGDLGTAVSNGASAVASSSVAFVGRGNDLVRYDPFSLAAGGTRLRTNVEVRTSPVLGQARSSGTEKGYAVDSTSGRLYVFDLNGGSDSAADFGHIFGIDRSVSAHPTLDCNRRGSAATSTTGILYIASSSGRLSAIIVDSPRLLTTAGAWPKYQRTASNSGNTNNAAFPLNPGCPN